MKSDNAAARLFDILKKGRGLNRDLSCKRAWCTLLEVDANDDLVLMSRIGKLMEIPGQIQSDIKEFFPNYTSVSSHWISQLARGFSTQNNDLGWSSFIDHIDDHTMQNLQTFAMLLEAKSQLVALDADSVSTIRQNLSDLYSEVMETAELSSVVKKHLLRHLRLLLTSLDEYKISGTLQVFEEIEKFVGHMYFDQSYSEEMRNTQIGGKVLDVLSATANAITIAVGLPQLASIAMPLLK